MHSGIYAFDAPFDTTISASLRMVADLGDPDKVVATLPGGQSGRIFDGHRDDQVNDFVKGNKRFWWFSDQLIQQHAQTQLMLIP